MNAAPVRLLAELEEKEALIGSFQGVDSGFIIVMDEKMALTRAAIGL